MLKGNTRKTAAIISLLFLLFRDIHLVQFHAAIPLCTVEEKSLQKTAGVFF